MKMIDTFIYILKTNHLRQLAAVLLFCMSALPLSAQETADSAVVFRFFSGKDMFIVPVLNNGKELTRLFDLVEQYKDKIFGNEISLRVDGYYISDGGKAEKYNTAKIRSNRVKSELITRKGLKEGNFVTRNQVGDANFVTVRFFKINKDGTLSMVTEEVQPTTEVNAEVADTVPVTPVEEQHEPPVSDEEVEATIIVVDTLAVADELPVVVDTLETLPVIRIDSRFLLKTNLLAYAILMPNLEIEWKFADKWSVALEGQRAWYAKSSPHKVYRVGTVTPELRYWPIEHSRWHGMYVGLFGGVGMYDLSNGKKGHKGEGAMGGLSAGYMWPIGKCLSLDAGLGVGYLRARDKVYVPQDGHFLYQLTQKINYVGPLRLKLSLVWRLQSEKQPVR